MDELAYYPGCSLHSTAKEMDTSFAGSMTRLGVHLSEIPGWQCCGNSAGHATNRLLATALPANELSKVRRDMRLGAVAVPCAACFSRFQAANHEVTDPSVAREVGEVTGRAYDGGVEVLNMVDVYHDHVGLDHLRAKVVEPFDGLKVAAYYGCLLTRPPAVTLAEDPEYPGHMDAVLEAIGCAPVAWDAKTDCCGASLALAERDLVDGLIAKIVTNARDRGADAIVCACPLCQLNLDTRQLALEKDRPGWERMPILYLSQMVGHALGVDDGQLGLDRALADLSEVFSCVARRD